MFCLRQVHEGDCWKACDTYVAPPDARMCLYLRHVCKVRHFLVTEHNHLTIVDCEEPLTSYSVIREALQQLIEHIRQ